MFRLARKAPTASSKVDALRALVVEGDRELAVRGERLANREAESRELGLRRQELQDE
ncbi:MAG: hypothetical protein ACP5E5_09535 [Acidobacteriaceae bacterium]